MNNETTNANGAGGAINIGNTSPIIMTDCVFKNNKSLKNGGAIYINSRIDMTNCLFEDNQAESGGAISQGDTSWIYDCTFKNNKAIPNETSGEGGHGGAILVGSSVVVDRSTFIENQALGTMVPGGVFIKYGGGSAIYSMVAEPKITLFNSTLYGNINADNVNNIGVVNSSQNIQNNKSGFMQIYHCTIANNQTNGRPSIVNTVGNRPDTTDSTAPPMRIHNNIIANNCTDNEIWGKSNIARDRDIQEAIDIGFEDGTSSMNVIQGVTTDVTYDNLFGSNKLVDEKYLPVQEGVTVVEGARWLDKKKFRHTGSSEGNVTDYVNLDQRKVPRPQDGTALFGSIEIRATQTSADPVGASLGEVQFSKDQTSIESLSGAGGENVQALVNISNDSGDATVTLVMVAYKKIDDVYVTTDAHVAASQTIPYGGRQITLEVAVPNTGGGAEGVVKVFMLESFPALTPKGMAVVIDESGVINPNCESS